MFMCKINVLKLVLPLIFMTYIGEKGMVIIPATSGPLIIVWCWILDLYVYYNNREIFVYEPIRLINIKEFDREKILSLNHQIKSLRIDSEIWGKLGVYSIECKTYFQLQNCRCFNRGWSSFAKTRKLDEMC